MPAFFFSYLDAVKTNSYWNAEPAEAAGRFPVVLYSPSGNASLHKLLFEELASHGYVVASISHPHWGNVMFDNQGRVIPQAPGDERAAAWWREQSAGAVQDAKGRILSTDDIAALKGAQIALNRAVPLAITELREWTQDDAFVLEHLARMNGAGGFFDGRLDLDHTGVMGFSLGGANAGQFCATDPRCRAGINLDGFMFGDILQRGLHVPFMFIHSDNSYLRPGLTAAYFYETAESNSYLLQIDGTLHGELGFPLPTGEPLLINAGLANFPDGARLGRILNEYILAFFNKYLKGQPEPLLSGPSTDQEVLFMCRNSDCGRR
jgi:predicted dienelactone hydrolase